MMTVLNIVKRKYLMKDIFDGCEIVFLPKGKEIEVYLKGLGDVKIAYNSDIIKIDSRNAIIKLKEKYENFKKSNEVQNINELNNRNKTTCTEWNLLDIRHDPDKDTYIFKFQNNSNEICILELPESHIDDLRIHDEGRWRDDNLTEKILENMETFNSFLNKTYTNNYQKIFCGVIGSQTFIAAPNMPHRYGKELLPKGFKFYLYKIPAIS